MIDVTDRVLEMCDELRTNPEAPLEYVPSSHPQAALMFAKLAAHHSDEIAKKPPRFDDLDHAINFQALAACLTHYINPAVTPSFEEPRRPDHQVAELFARQLMDTLNRHQAACIRNGLWRIYYDPTEDRFHSCLTKRRRLSALVALDSFAQEDLLDDTTGGLLSSGKTSDDAIYFALASSVECLRFLTNSTAKSWADFTSAAGFSSNELTEYVGFLEFLGFAAITVGHSLCYSRDFLLRLREIFTKAFSCTALSNETLMRLMDLFSLSPAEASDYALPVPFFRIGDYYIRYHGFSRIMSPVMGLLTIVIRKHEPAWNRTLGSTLSYAADAVAAALPKYERLEVAVRRNIRGKGDIDLALYDTISGHMLVCEVKTVYDKHRTVHQMHRFEDAKVNLARAIYQIRRSVAAVASGALSMKTIFGKPLPSPVHVNGVLLTWLDAIDLTMGTPNEEIFSLNFAALRYMLKQAGGDISVMMRSVAELRNIWCIARRRPLDLGQPGLNSDLESQVLTLDSISDLSALSLTGITLEVLKTFPSLSNDWRTLPEHSMNTVSYLSDSKQALSKL